MVKDGEITRGRFNVLVSGGLSQDHLSPLKRANNQILNHHHALKGRGCVPRNAVLAAQQKGLVFRRGLLIAIWNIALACGGSRLLAEDGVMNFEKLRHAGTDAKVLHDRTDRLEEFLKILA